MFIKHCLIVNTFYKSMLELLELLVIVLYDY